MAWLDKLFPGTGKSPFGDQPKLIYHGAHHKMGTVWLMRILEKVTAEFDFKLQKSNSPLDQINPDAQVFFSNHSQHWDEFKKVDSSRAVGSHMIRDARDTIVSGYFYHLWTDESWAHVPREEFDGQSYQEQLKSLSQDDGLSLEIQNFSRYANDYGMRSWDYQDDRILELRYEELIKNETEQFERLFRHYGFSDASLQKCLDIAATQSFKTVAKRRLGESNPMSHLRSGKPGEWKSVLNRDHLNSIDDSMGDLISLMGY